MGPASSWSCTAPTTVSMSSVKDSELISGFDIDDEDTNWSVLPNYNKNYAETFSLPNRTTQCIEVETFVQNYEEKNLGDEIELVIDSNYLATRGALDRRNELLITKSRMKRLEMERKFTEEQAPIIYASKSKVKRQRPVFHSDVTFGTGTALPKGYADRIMMQHHNKGLFEQQCNNQLFEQLQGDSDLPPLYNNDKKLVVRNCENDAFLDEDGKQVLMLTCNPRPRLKKKKSRRGYRKKNLNNGFSDEYSSDSDCQVRGIKERTTLQQVLPWYADFDLNSDDRRLMAAENAAYRTLLKQEQEAELEAWLALPEYIPDPSSMSPGLLRIELSVAASFRDCWRDSKFKIPTPSQTPIEWPAGFFSWWSSNEGEHARLKFLNLELGHASESFSSQFDIQQGDASSRNKIRRQVWRDFRKWYFGPESGRDAILQNEYLRLKTIWNADSSQWKLHKLTEQPNLRWEICQPFQPEPLYVSHENEFYETWGPHLRHPKQSKSFMELEVNVAMADPYIRSIAVREGLIKCNFQVEDEDSYVFTPDQNQPWHLYDVETFSLWLCGNIQVRKLLFLKEFNSLCRDIAVQSHTVLNIEEYPDEIPTEAFQAARNYLISNFPIEDLKLFNSDWISNLPVLDEEGEIVKNQFNLVLEDAKQVEADTNKQVNTKYECEYNSLRYNMYQKLQVQHEDAEELDSRITALKFTRELCLRDYSRSTMEALVNPRKLIDFWDVLENITWSVFSNFEPLALQDGRKVQLRISPTLKASTIEESRTNIREYIRDQFKREHHTSPFLFDIEYETVESDTCLYNVLVEKGVGFQNVASDSAWYFKSTETRVSYLSNRLAQYNNFELAMKQRGEVKLLAHIGPFACDEDLKINAPSASVERRMKRLQMRLWYTDKELLGDDILLQEAELLGEQNLKMFLDKLKAEQMARFRLLLEKQLENDPQHDKTPRDLYHEEKVRVQRVDDEPEYEIREKANLWFGNQAEKIEVETVECWKGGSGLENGDEEFEESMALMKANMQNMEAMERLRKAELEKMRQEENIMRDFYLNERRLLLMSEAEARLNGMVYDQRNDERQKRNHPSGLCSRELRRLERFQMEQEDQKQVWLDIDAQQAQLAAEKARLENKLKQELFENYSKAKSEKKAAEKLKAFEKATMLREFQNMDIEDFRGRMIRSRWDDDYNHLKRLRWMESIAYGYFDPFYKNKSSDHEINESHVFKRTLPNTRVKKCLFDLPLTNEFQCVLGIPFDCRIKSNERKIEPSKNTHPEKTAFRRCKLSKVKSLNQFPDQDSSSQKCDLKLLPRKRIDEAFLGK